MKSPYLLPVAWLLLTVGACRSGVRKDDFCRADANALASAVMLFEIQTGSIPTSAQGLGILEKHPVDLQSDLPYVVKLPTDSWGNSFRYVPDCDARPQKFEIISLGEDGIPSSDDRVFSFTVEHGEQLMDVNRP